MNLLGIELCDAGLQAARNDEGAVRMVDFEGIPDDLGWPAVACANENKLVFGLDAEASWFVHPRSVSNLFWEKLSHETSELSRPGGSPYTYSQLAFYFLHDYLERVRAGLPHAPEKVVVAVPGHYLRDAAAEEETIGLLLGMASELRLPLIRVLDLGSAALWEPAAREFPAGVPIVHVDIHLHGTEISVYRRDSSLTRIHYHHVPLAGYAQILRHLKNTMGNRFLRHTAFDIHEDRRLEQAFYEQTKRFLFSASAPDKEFLYQVNTGTRSYQMIATRSQLASDLHSLAQSIAQAVAGTARDTGTSPSHCVVSLTDRAARLEGLQARLNEAGFRRIFPLRTGAAARGAATLAQDWPAIEDLADVPVETTVTPRHVDARDLPMESVLHQTDSGEERPAPSHVIVDGIGHAIGEAGLTFGTRHTLSHVDVALPESFDAVGDYAVRVVREGKELRLELPGNDKNDALPVSRLAAGDRLSLKGGRFSLEMLFAHCPSAGRNGHGT